MRALIDIDGVVMDMLSAVKSVYPDFRPEYVTDYGFKCECGIPRELVLKAITTPAVFAQQRVYTLAFEGILLLQAHGIETWAYTEVAESCVEIRNIQLKDLGLLGSAFIYGKDSQKPVNMSGYDVLFEDNPATLDSWTSGIQKYIIDRPYNKGYTGAVRCSNLLKAAEHFIGGISGRI